MKPRNVDGTEPAWIILAAVTCLIVIGVASIYVTDTHYSSGHDGPRNAAKQCVFVLVGAVLTWAVLRIGYLRVSRHAYAIFAVALIALVPLVVAKTFHLTFGGVIAPINGAYRWIRLPGFQLQPSEFMKVAYLLALAWYLRYRKNYRRLGGLLLPFLISVLPLSLILLQPDLGMVLLLIPVLFAMLFMAGARIRHLAIIVGMGVAAAPLAWGQIQGYQRLRVTSVLLQSDRVRQAVIANPKRFRVLATKRQAVEWAASSGYQLVHAKNAIGSGRLVGHGWGKGVYARSQLLPDRHNDFVLAIVGHQWGLVGCLLVLSCYAAIVIAGARIASVTTDPFGRLLAVGVVTLIAAQVMINMGASLGITPITGMTLPFLSYGGSSLLSNFIALGLLISVSQRRPYLLATRPFEFSRQRMHKPHLFERGQSQPPGDDAVEAQRGD